MYLKIHLTVLSNLILLLQLDQCGGALSSMPRLGGPGHHLFLQMGWLLGCLLFRLLTCYH